MNERAGFEIIIKRCEYMTCVTVRAINTITISMRTNRNKIRVDKYFLHIFRTPCFKEGGVNFNHLSRRGGFLKIKKRGWKYGAGAGLLKRGAGIFPIYFFKGLSFLHLKITLSFAKLCYAFEEKKFFSATIIFWKKVIWSCLKMTLKISHKLR